MYHLKKFGLILWVGLLAQACAGYELRPMTPTVTGVVSIPGETATAATNPTLVPSTTISPTGAWISLTPASGRPGDTIQVDGFMPNPPPADLQNSSYQTYANICWGGCQTGLLEDGLEMTWSTQNAGHFSLSFRVPQAPWLSTDGPHALDAGDYPITLQFLEMGSDACPTPSLKGCLLEVAAGTHFHLAAGSSGPACPDLSCAWLKLAPAHAAPGEMIQVTGWAPLLQIIGQPFGYNLALVLSGGNSAAPSNLFSLGQPVTQAMDGSLSASFQAPQFSGDGTPLLAGDYQVALEADGLAMQAGEASATPGVKAEGKGAPPLLLAPTAFSLTVAPAWTALRQPSPLWVQPAASLLTPVVAADPSNPARLAYCAPGAIRASQDGGASWISIPTAPVEALLAMGPYALGSSPAACTSVMLDEAHPRSFYAVFSTTSKQYGAPPEYFMGFFTPDDGKTWQAVPTPPQGHSPPMVERFGGFWTNGTVAQALYLGDTSGADAAAAPPVLVEQTMDGGASWEPAGLTCPPGGPCLRWGPAASTISGMGAGLPQWVMGSRDGGRSWASSGQPVELRMSGPQELAAFSPTEALLVSGDAVYPLRYTRDGGQSWQALSLPSLPGAMQFNGLQFLPDGSLLAMNPDSGAWYRLAPAAQAWCDLHFPIAGNYPVMLQAAGGRVWWLLPEDGSLQSAPLNRFWCG